MINEKKLIVLGASFLLVFLIAIVGIKNFIQKEDIENKTLTATVISIQNDKIIAKDENNLIYTFGISNTKEIEVGSEFIFEYKNVTSKETGEKEKQIINYQNVSKDIEEVELKDLTEIPNWWMDNGIFSKYYQMAFNKLKTMSQDEMIGQLFLVRYSDNWKSIIEDYKVAGFVFYEKDFTLKTETDVKTWIQNLQKTSNIPLLTAVDEEGGKVVRVSSNKNLRSEPFKSSSELYSLGGLNKIKEDTKEKSTFLKNLGINLNLAPVIDVTTDPNAYMYERSIKQNTSVTSTYSKTVIDASKSTGVSYTLKHFPGYGNNTDTHIESATDNRTYDEILENDIPPFKEGINTGAEAIMVGHQTVNAIDKTNPASLSSDVYNMLRGDLGFTGVIITDDLAMGATANIENSSVKALLAGATLIIVTDYEEGIKQVKNALNNGTISEKVVAEKAFKVLSWKYYKGLTLEQQK